MPIDFEAIVRHEEHIDLRGRKQLLAKLLIARSFGSTASDLPEGLLSAVKSASNNEELIEDSGCSLEDFIRYILGEAVAWTNRHRRSGSPKVQTAVASFRADLKRVSCRECVRRRLPPGLKHDNQAIKSAICNGANDAENLKGDPRCWKFFNRLFEKLVKVAECAYRRVLCSEVERLRIQFKTVRTNGSCIRANTTFPNHDSLPSRAAVASITFPVVDFHHGHYFTLPYYIFHEICVHTPQAWRVSGRRNRELDATETCPLREGFVDAAAHKLLERALENPRRFDLHRGFLEDFSVYSSKAHFDRVTPDPLKQQSKRPEDEEECAAVEARLCGEKLFRRMGAQEPKDRPKHVIRFALSLNVLPLTKDDRTRLVTQLDKGSLGEPAELSSDDAGRQDSRTRRRGWIAGLRAAAQSGDLEELERLVGVQLGSALAFDKHGREEF
jgi:hypothetical protein